VFTLPEKFNRNAPDVQQLGPPADTGEMLLKYMAERVGVDLADEDILDFGCGGRFTEAIITKSLRVKSYTGGDLYKDLIDYLSENVRDPRFSFFHPNFQNVFYNPEGLPIHRQTELPLDRTFSLVCMFSVITHQNPMEATATFKLLRKYVRPDGRLFFSAAIEPEMERYGEKIESKPGSLSVYADGYMRDMLRGSGWTVDSFQPKNPRGLPILASYVCSPILAPPGKPGVVARMLKRIGL